MASQDPWVDFETHRHNVKHNTVDRLKQILQGFNDECGTHISKSGKKQEIIDKIVSILESWKQQNAVDKWNKAKAVLQQVRATGAYSPSLSRMAGSSSSLSSPSSTAVNYPPTSYAKTNDYNTPLSSVSRYDPYSSRKPTTAYTPPTVPKPQTAAKPALQFKESPFFKVDQIVSQIVECPETTSASDRRQQSLQFTLSDEHLDKLKQPNSRYQLRLFCTSSMFYSPNSTFRTSSTPCPIEFPPTCEVRVNNVPLTASLKGLKKKPGTAPPPDLGKYVRMTTTQNRIEMVYVNSQQPTQPKKFYLVVMMVEVTTVDSLVNDLKRTKFKSGDEVRRQLQASVQEDEDIIAGPQKMSLKCPLSFMRVNTPCRSSKCVHSQCFDATSWFSVMEQTTTYLCPVCERVLDWKDLIIDGAFDEILKACPDSVEDVMVEADGEWHTTDNKYGSASWKIKHPPMGSLKPPSPIRQPSSTIKTELQEPTVGLNGAVDRPKEPNDMQITVIDSDDEEEEGLVKRELSPSTAHGTSAGPQSHPPPSQDDVIDLTIDSDDDEEPSPPKQIGKRTASDAALSPTEAIWKKGRTDADNNAYRSLANDTAYSRSSDSRTSAHTSPPRRPSNYNGPTLPPLGNSFGGRNSGSAPQLPPLSGLGPYNSRGSGSSSTWS
ncbi:miz zinc finger protein [Moniliophthora roreri MCA 2997]|uniref:Miz zinc finger protein n=2 Tax=Moniliophthora roreri TaxID=221103 RepID=V2XVX6_MONRO|nr:miz zinc finger protein [Moniliophthora roreri MCA 2997]KAI3622355.1 miz zinc finger protein [Moniliophthora roreri]